MYQKIFQKVIELLFNTWTNKREKNKIKKIKQS